MFKKITTFASGHKILSGFIVLVFVLTSYFWYQAANSTAKETRYVLTTVQKGTLITSVSGTGQVSVSDQLDVKPKTSGDVIYVIPRTKLGQTIKAGTLIAELDTTDAQKAVRNAQINLDNAQIALAKLQINQKNDVPNIQDSITSAQNNLNQTYLNGFNEVVSSFSDFPAIIDEIRGVLYDSKVGTSGQTNTGAYQDLIDSNNLSALTPIINQAAADYLIAYQKYNQNLLDYTNFNNSSDSAQTSALVGETLDTAKAMIQAVKDEQNMLNMVTSSLKQYSRTIPSAVTQYQTDTSTHLNQLNGRAGNLTNVGNSITSNQQSLANNQRNLDSAQQSDPLNLASQQNSLKQAQASLDDAKETLADCYVTALVSGILAKVNVNVHDSASSGTAVATVITPQQVAELSLNEVDAAKIKIGDKTTLTFNAIPDLTISGQVLEIDTLGTVSQGVVSYNVKIGLDTPDNRIKPGMSVSASIITNVKNDALLVPNSAIKTIGGVSYVQVVNSSTPELQASSNAGAAGILLSVLPSQQQVQIGTTNDTDTEIISGLNEGDTVVSRTVMAASAAKPTSTQSIFSATGARTGGASRTGGNMQFRGN